MSERIGLNFEDISLEAFSILHKIRISCYGTESEDTQASMANVITSLENFWRDQIETAERQKTVLIENIELMGKEAVELERILNLPQQVKELDKDIPLLQLKTTLENVVKSYRELGNQRIKGYEEICKEEEKICSLLGEQIKNQPLASLETSSGLKSSQTVSRSQTIPSDEKLAECRLRVHKLRILEADMREEFLHLKEELRILLKECERVPLTEYEHFATSTDEDSSTLVPFSGASLKEMREIVRSEFEKKEKLVAEADNLRLEISNLSKKLMKDPMILESLFAEHNGFGRPTILKLQKVLDELIAERKFQFKELILLHRDMLEDLWSKCHYTDQQRLQFKAYYADHFSEDILSLHELEVEYLTMFCNEHKRIFELAEKHKELWDRLIHLEQQASSSERLFTNRGGRLLLEEKERKTIQKKLPAVKAELVTLLNQFKAKNGTDFLDFGVPLIDALERLQEEREAAKEDEKKQGKATNSETIRLESRLGTQPVANKRKVLAPKSNCTKIMKMSAHSTVNQSTTLSSKSTSSCKVLKLQPMPSHNTLLTPGRIGVGAAAGSYVMRHTPQMLQVPSATPSQSTALKTPVASTPSKKP